MEGILLFKELLRYGTIKADYEIYDGFTNFYHIRVFDLCGKKYFTAMCNGEVVRCEEV
jgi:hypothetical protein